MSKIRDEKLEKLALAIANHQAGIEKLGVKWAALLVQKLDATEAQLMEKITDFMQSHKKGLRSATALADLERLERKIAKIRKEAYQAAYNEMMQEGRELEDNEQKWAKRLTSEVGADPKDLRITGEKVLKENLKSSFVKGMNPEEWFSGTARADLNRIVDMVRDGVRSGMTIQQMVKAIRGTKENDYTDGIMETSRRHATTMARTLCSGFANNAKDEFYRKNSDIVIGVEWLDTLDGRTCPQCASMSRMRWKTTEPHPVPPAHHNCRCVLIPVTELTDMGDDVPRPAANADFNAEAKRLYETKYPKKKFDELSDSTRKKYYYEAQREFEKRTGKPAYSRAPGSMKFKDYFQQMSDKQKLDYLGKAKYELWKTGRYSIDDFFPPFPQKAYTVKQLKAMDKEGFLRFS